MERQSFRQWGQLMVGVTLGALAAAIGAAALAGLLSDRGLGAAWCAGLAWLAYAVFIRPCVVVGGDGVRLCNVLSDVTLPWSSIADTSTAWSLVVATTDKRYSSWAISSSASPGRDALSRREAVLSGVGRPSAAGGAHTVVVGPVEVAAGLMPPTIGASAPALAALIERERTQDEQTVATASAEAVATVRVAWTSVVLLCLAATVVVVGTW